MTTFQNLDLTYLDSLIDGDVETKQVILATLLEEVPEEIEKIKAALELHDWKELHELSHKLKSTLAYVGNDAIFKANENIMLAARSMENLDKIPAWFAQVETKWADIEPEIGMALDEL